MFVLFLAGYAWRDWYKSLCGLIMLIAVVQHPDFPNSVFGIHGMNPWNILLAVVFVAWLASRSRENLKYDAPSHIIVLMVIFFGIIITAYLRSFGDQEVLAEYYQIIDEQPPTTMYLFSEYIINCLKWVVPGLLLYDGCRSEARLKLAVFAIMTMYVLLGLQVIRWMPLAMLSSGEELSVRALKILQNEVGFHRVNISMMLAGASWAVYAVRDLPNHYLARMACVGLAGVLLFAVALTGGRMGQITWVVLGAIFAVWKWRKLMLVGPLLVVLVVVSVPAVRDRLMQGVGDGEIQTNQYIEETTNDEDGEFHWYTISSGRTFAWPFVIEKISDHPIIGYGRNAMQRSGVASTLLLDYGESFPHPHNAYLEWIFDNGMLGAVPVFALFIIFVRRAKSLFDDDTDPAFVAVGGMCLALTLAFLIAGLGSQTFYPREGAVGMWCAIGLMLRVYVQREKKSGSSGHRPATSRPEIAAA